MYLLYTLSVVCVAVIKVLPVLSDWVSLQKTQWVHRQKQQEEY